MYRLTNKLPVFLCLFLLAGLAFAGSGRAADTPHIVIDAGTGAIISQHRANDRWHPASLTKLMTAYVTMRAIANGEIADGSPVRISNAATRQPPSKMGYREGVELRMDAALKIIVIKSANDVSLALAEAVAGTLDKFVARMNAEATRLGMTNTRFTNSNGLHSREQVTSARDMALLSARILAEFPRYANLFSAVAIRTPQATHYSYNLLLERFAGANGLKTGFVCASGYNLAASATRNARTLIAVVLGRSSQTDRAVSAAKLLEEGFQKPGAGSVYLPVLTGREPENMRSRLCTEEARAARYDPGAGSAVIESRYLSPRKLSNNILDVTPGGVDAPPSDAYLTRLLTVSGSVPVPSLRPDFDPASGQVKLIAIGNASTNSLPLPTPRPQP